jgi:hypothetical protein
MVALALAHLHLEGEEDAARPSSASSGRPGHVACQVATCADFLSKARHQMLQSREPPSRACAALMHVGVCVRPRPAANSDRCQPAATTSKSRLHYGAKLLLIRWVSLPLSRRSNNSSEGRCTERTCAEFLGAVAPHNRTPASIRTRRAPAGDVQPATTSVHA